MVYSFEKPYPIFTEINFTLFFIILIHCLETNRGYDVEELIEIFQRSDATIRSHLKRLGESQLIKKEKPFGSQKDYFIVNPDLLRDLENQGINVRSFGNDLKKILIYLYQIFKTS